MRSFRFAQSSSIDVSAAVAELYAGIEQDNPALVLFFCSSAYDLPRLADEINRRFTNVPVLGCTSAGGVGPGMYGQRVLSGVSFARGACSVAVDAVHNLQSFDPQQAQAMVVGLYQRLEQAVPGFSPADCFAFQMIDGMSVREEPVTRTLQGALGLTPLIGGSAGDDMNFNRSWVFSNGAFHEDSAAVALVHTRLPFMSFMTQHFEPTGEPLVVTEADAPRRIVIELNGLPAAAEYARCAGVKVAQIDSALFADRPMLVTIGDGHYVRSIQRAFPDGTLSFYCAIEEGVVLRVSSGGNLLGNLEEQFRVIRERIGSPALILGCDCVLRRLVVERYGLVEPVQQLLAANRVIGFCSYGEQYRSLHLNQTMTGVAIGGHNDGV